MLERPRSRTRRFRASRLRRRRTGRNGTGPSPWRRRNCHQGAPVQLVVTEQRGGAHSAARVGSARLGGQGGQRRYSPGPPRGKCAALPGLPLVSRPVGESKRDPAIQGPAFRSGVLGDRLGQTLAHGAGRSAGRPCFSGTPEPTRPVAGRGTDCRPRSRSCPYGRAPRRETTQAGSGSRRLNRGAVDPVGQLGGAQLEVDGAQDQLLFATAGSTRSPAGVSGHWSSGSITPSPSLSRGAGGGGGGGGGGGAAAPPARPWPGGRTGTRSPRSGPRGRRPRCRTTRLGADRELVADHQARSGAEQQATGRVVAGLPRRR